MIIGETKKLGEMKTVGSLQTIKMSQTPSPSYTPLSGQIGYLTTYVSIHQIREIAGCLFAQNFHTQFEEANGYPFQADTLHPSIPELKESPVEEEQQDQWEINTNDEIPGLGNFENAE